MLRQFARWRIERLRKSDSIEKAGQRLIVVQQSGVGHSSHLVTESSRQLLEDSIQDVVRRAFRRRGTASRLDEQVLGMAAQMPADTDQFEVEKDELIDNICRSILDCILTELANAVPSGIRETMHYEREMTVLEVSFTTWEPDPGTTPTRNPDVNCAKMSPRSTHSTTPSSFSPSHRI